MEDSNKTLQFEQSVYDTLNKQYPNSWHWISEVPDEDFMILLLYMEEVADNTSIRDILKLPKPLHRFMLAIFMQDDQGSDGNAFYKEYQDKTIRDYVTEQEDPIVIRDLTNRYILNQDLSSFYN